MRLQRRLRTLDAAAAMRRALACAALVVALTGCAIIHPAAPTAIPAAVRLDTSGAQELLRFYDSLQQGLPWDEAAIRRLVGSPPYQALLVHHGSSDPAVTTEALVQLLLAVRDGQDYANSSPRLRRMFVTYRWARSNVGELRARLARLNDPAMVDRAVKLAQAALPPQAHLEATVYVLADGYSPAYLVGHAIVLDVLEIASSSGVDKPLAHELHHIGANSLLPAPCEDSALARTLVVVAGLAQEGAATYWIDGLRTTPKAADFQQVEAFLSDDLQSKLKPGEAEQRLAGLLQNGGGPFYAVGNAMIARLVDQRGEAWVRANLGNPVGLLRAYRSTGEWSSVQGVFDLLNKACSSCRAWCRSSR